MADTPELSDSDVFGSSPQGQLSDADVFGGEPQPKGTAPSLAAVPGEPGGFSRTMMSMVPFGRDIGAAGAAAGKATRDMITGKDTNFGQDFQSFRDQDKAMVDQYIADHPILGRVAEGIGIVPGMASSGARGAATLAGRAAEGARMGALYGAGTSDGSVADRVAATGEGAVTGGVLGAAMPYVARGIGKAAGWVGDQVGSLIPPSSEEAAQTTAGKVLNKIATGQSPTFEPAPVPGMTPTAGQASNDPGILWAERAAQTKDPQALALSKQAETGNNQAIRSAIEGLGSGSAGGEPAQIMLDRLEAAKKAARDSVRSTWNAAGLDETAPISSQPLKQAVTAYLDGLAPIERSNLPTTWLAALDDLGDTTTLKELQAFRSSITGSERMAFRSGNPNDARLLGGLSDIMEAHTEDPALIGMENVDQSQAIQAARQATKEFHQTYSQPAPVRNALGVDRFGADKIAPSDIADTFIRTGKGAPEAWQAYLDAIKSTTTDNLGNRVTTYDPEALDAARSAFSDRFLAKVENAGLDQNGQKLLSAPKVSKFVDDYGHVINSPLFTPAQRQMISNIVDGANMAARTARGAPPAGGSDTAAKLYGGKYLDALIGKWPAKALSAGGGYIAGAASGIPGGGVVGALTGAAGSDALTNALYGASKEKVVAVLNDALHDPALAKALMSRASQGASKTMPSAASQALWARLGEITGGSAAGSSARRQTPAAPPAQSQSPTPP